MILDFEHMRCDLINFDDIKTFDKKTQMQKLMTKNRI